MAAEDSDEHVFQRIFEQVNQHLETRWEYFTLISTEKISVFAANLAGAVSLFVFAVIMLFFFSMGFAWWLGDFINNRAGGFALAGLIFLPVALLFFRWVRPYVQAKVIQSILQDQDAENPVKHG